MTDREYFKKSAAANAWANKAFETICRNYTMTAKTYKKACRQIARFEKAAEKLPADTLYNCSFFGKVNYTWVNREYCGDREQMAYALADAAASARNEK